MLPGAAAAAPGSLPAAPRSARGAPPTADSRGPAASSDLSPMLVRDQQAAPRSVPCQHPGARLPGGAHPRGRSPAGSGAAALCELPSSSARQPAAVAGRERRASGRSREKPGRCWGAPGRGGRSPVLRASRWPAGQSCSWCRRIGGGASAVLRFTSKGPACISAGRGGRSRGQQSVSDSRRRFKRGSPREREVSAERKHQTRRAPFPSPGSAARPRLGLAGSSGPPRPGRDARHRPGTPPAAAVRGGAASRSRRAGAGRWSPQKSGAAGGAAGRLRCLGLPPGPGAGAAVRGTRPLGKGRRRGSRLRGRRGRDGAAERSAGHGCYR